MANVILLLMRSTLVCFCLALLLPMGCAITDRVTYTDQEGPVPDDIIQHIVNEETEKPWVLAHLGEPFAIDRVQTGGDTPTTLYEVYTYRFSRSAVRSGHVMVFFKAGAREDTIEYLHIAFEKEQVQKAWLDKFKHANVATQLREERVKTVKVASKNTEVNAEPVEEKPRFDWKVPILKKWFSGSSDEASEKKAAEKHAMAEESVSKETSMTEAPMANSHDAEKEMADKGASENK